MQMNQLFGCVIIKITSADCMHLLNALTESGVKLYEVTSVDELTVLVTISKNHISILEDIAQKKCVSIEIMHRFGIFWAAKALLKRPVLVAFFLIIMLLSLYLPSRVLFISVEGNVTVSDRQILEAAEDCGIKFGSSRVAVRSEKIKNALLEKMPQLQWAGINTTGCTATISVRERTIQQGEEAITKGIYSIVAARDGIIQNCTVFSGNPLCSVGQAVKEGQVLVSGYLDLGIVTQGTRAEAEISALTFHKLDLISLNAQSKRGDISDTKKRYSIRIGKKVIKFYKDSGNLDTSCAKIYSEEYVCLPGGFQLPISFITEQVYRYKEVENTAVSTQERDWMAECAQTYLKEKMIAGQIISAETEIIADETACRLHGQYACLEQIGKLRPEQMQPKDG